MSTIKTLFNKIPQSEIIGLREKLLKLSVEVKGKSSKTSKT